MSRPAGTPNIKGPIKLKPAKRGRVRLQAVMLPALSKKKVTVAGMKRFVSQMLAAYAPHVIPEAMETLRHAMNKGDIRAAEQILKSFAVLNSAGIHVNQTNVNTAATESATHRSFESIIRNASVKQGAVIDMVPGTVPQRRLEMADAGSDSE